MTGDNSVTGLKTKPIRITTLSTSKRSQNSSSRGWGSYTAFLFAAVGSSIGLGNLWKFPYELGLHGGTFLVVYVFCVVLVAFPLMLSELAIGRLGRESPIRSIAGIVNEYRYSTLWQGIGWLGIITGFLIFSFYSVVASWILFYLMQSLGGSLIDAPAEIVRHSFSALLRNSDQMILWHSVFVLMVVSVLSQPVRVGLERAVRFLMPLCAVFVIWLYFNLSDVGNVAAAKEFMFSFSLQNITPELVVSALTQALFSLSIGIGILILYGSYLSDDRPLLIGAGAIAVFDTLFAVAMAVFIFSIVFKFGLQANAGPGLIFQTLPVAFSQMPQDQSWVASLFFLLLLIAALTSGFALLEPTIAMLVDRTNLPRRAAAWLAGSVAWALGLLSVFALQGNQFGFFYFSKEYYHGYFDLFNILSTHLLLPLTALLITLFVSWVLPRTLVRETMRLRYSFTFSLWRFCSRTLAPIIIGVVLLLVLAYPS